MKAAKVSYIAIDNGGKPFRTVIENGKATVWAYNHRKIPNRPYLSFPLGAIFVGKSPIHAPGEWDGNSLLLQKKGDEAENIYYHVGATIFSFKTAAPIIYYTSPVGNSCVPYPWAQDAIGTIYLMIEEIQFPGASHLAIGASHLAVDALLEVKDQFDAYDIYYGEEFPFAFEGLYPVTNKIYKFKWVPDDDLEREYKHRVDGHAERLKTSIKHPDVETTIHLDDAPLELGKETWMATIHGHGMLCHLKKMDVLKVICKRVF